MKTHVAVYEEGLFDLRGANLYKGGQMPPLLPTPSNPAMATEVPRQLRPEDIYFLTLRFG